MKRFLMQRCVLVLGILCECLDTAVTHLPSWAGSVASGLLVTTSFQHQCMAPCAAPASLSLHVLHCSEASHSYSSHLNIAVLSMGLYVRPHSVCPQFEELFNLKKISVDRYPLSVTCHPSPIIKAFSSHYCSCIFLILLLEV